MSTKQTEALKLALEALKMCRALIRINIERLVPIESPNPWFSRDVDHAITAIREALAEQPYPDNFIDALKYDVAKRDSEALAEQPAQQQEPVAPLEHWCTYCQGHNPHLCQFNQIKYWPQTYVTNNTSPPASKPLTDEQIQYAFRTNSVVIDDGNAYMVAGKRAIKIARAIEAAHGITGEQK